MQVTMVRRIRECDTTPRNFERARGPAQRTGIEDGRNRDSGGYLWDVKLSSGQTEFVLDTTSFDHLSWAACAC